MKILFYIFTIILLIFGSNVACYANDTNKLHKIKTEILQLKSIITHAHNQQSYLEEQLKKTEINIGALSVQLQQNQQALSQQKTLLKNLSQEQLRYESQLSDQQQTLSTQLRAMYMLGQQQYLKVMLNQQDPDQVSRIITYYRYINSQRMQLIDQFNTMLATVSQNKQQIEQQTQKLQSMGNQLERNKNQLEQSQMDRQQVLQTLNKEIQSKQQQLQTLTSNKQALENIIKHLLRPNLKRFFAPTNFFAHHGKFPWPTRGKLIERFGTTIQQSQLKSSGVLIAANEGQNVYAIAPGKVVFANWMAGYGLLTIVDHGNGFMSIYGRNQAIYKKVGDTVKTGDLIAAVGNSGGYKSSALYFGIRENGHAVDPERWCG